MRITRLVSTSLVSLTLGLLFSACAASNVGLPPGGYLSQISCSSTPKCDHIRVPRCTRNEHLCVQGKCVISDIPGCVASATPATP